MKLADEFDGRSSNELPQYELDEFLGEVMAKDCKNLAIFLKLNLTSYFLLLLRRFDFWEI